MVGWVGYMCICNVICWVKVLWYCWYCYDVNLFVWLVGFGILLLLWLLMLFFMLFFKGDCWFCGMFFNDGCFWCKVYVGISGGSFFVLGGEVFVFENKFCGILSKKWNNVCVKILIIDFLFFFVYGKFNMCNNYCIFFGLYKFNIVLFIRWLVIYLFNYIYWEF